VLTTVCPSPSRKVDVRLPGKGNSNSQAGPPNHHDDKVDSDQKALEVGGAEGVVAECGTRVLTTVRRSPHTLLLYSRYRS